MRMIEAAVIDRVLMTRFGLDGGSGAGLREEGEDGGSGSHRHLPVHQGDQGHRSRHDDRVAIVEELWRVILSDGVRDPHEDTLMRQMVDRLGLSSMDSALARQKVQGGGSIQA